MRIGLRRWQFSVLNLLVIMAAIAMFVLPIRTLWEWSSTAKIQPITVPNGATMIIGGQRFFLDSHSRTRRQPANSAASKKPPNNLPSVFSVSPRGIIQEEEEALLVR